MFLAHAPRVVELTTGAAAGTCVRVCACVCVCVRVCVCRNYRFVMTTNPSSGGAFQRVVGRTLPASAQLVLVAYRSQEGFDVVQAPVHVGPDLSAMQLAMNAQELGSQPLEPNTATVYLMNGIVGLDTRVDAFVVDSADLYSFRVLQNLDPGYLQKFTLDTGPLGRPTVYRMKVVPTGTVGSFEEYEAAKSLVEAGELEFRLEPGQRYFGALYGWYKIKVDINPTEAALHLRDTGEVLRDIRPQFPIRLAITPAFTQPRYLGDPNIYDNVDAANGRRLAAAASVGGGGGGGSGSGSGVAAGWDARAALTAVATVALGALVVMMTLRRSNRRQQSNTDDSTDAAADGDSDADADASTDSAALRT